MLGWQTLARAFGLISSVWAARCLGPQKLGISGMVISTVWQLALLVNLNQDTALIRSYKACKTKRERCALISSVVSFRLSTALGIVVLGCGLLPWIHLSSRWRLAVIAAVPLLLLNTNGSAWILQARETAPIYRRSLAIQAGLMLLLYISFMRPGASAGLDVVINASALLFASVYGWRHALEGCTLHLSVAGLCSASRRVCAEKWMVLTGFAIFIYTNLGTPLVGYLAGVEQAGQFRSAWNLSNVYAQATQIMTILLYPRFIAWHQENPEILRIRQNKIALALAAVLIPFVALMFAMAPTIFRMFYGPAFGAAAYPWAILMTSKSILAISGIYSAGLWARSQDSGIASAMMLTAAISLVLNLIAIPALGITGAALVTVLSESFILVAAIILTRRVCKPPVYVDLNE